jgi:hypothetical protein
MATITKTEVPLWTEDSPTHYFAAMNYHKPWTGHGPFLTPLTNTDEDDFEDWVNTFAVPCDITASVINYDWRGYWVARIKGTAAGWSIVQRPPDFWLTPYSTMFSVRSLYAKPACPYHWTGDKLFDESNGLMLFWAGYTAPQQKAVDILEKSKIDPRAQAKGLMGDDLDMEKFRLYVSGKLRLKADDQILDAEIIRTIEGASTITFSLDDSDREILRSGLLNKWLDFELDGLWWRLCNVSMNQDELKLTFETREISILRLYAEFMMQQRDGNHTRAQFILRLIREALPNTPVVIPELGIQQEIEGQATTTNGTSTIPGIPNDLPAADDPIDTILDPRRSLTVKGARADKEQINNVNAVLAEGMRLQVRRKILVCAIMTIIVESTCHNYPGGDQDSVGLFQQRDSWGSYEERHDPATAANKFYRSCVIEDRGNPNLTYNDLCANTQRPRADLRDRYGLYKGEAENFVTAYLLSTGKKAPDEDPKNALPGPPRLPGTPPIGIPPAYSGEGGGTNRSDMGGYSGENTFFYYRGIPGNNADDWAREDSWSCIRRLADEVNWRAFFIGGTFWYIDDAHLLAIKPIMTITESSPGIDSISFDYDNNKKNATVTVKCRIGRWLAPPGAVVELKNMGPVSGRWLVNEFSRSLFDLTATIILKKPLPELPEEATNVVEPPSQPGEPSTTGPSMGGVPGENNGTRKAIVATAKRALEVQSKWKYNYEQIRPYPDSLWSESAHNRGIDCSVFCILVYKEAGASDPADLGFNGSGNSDSIARSSTGHWTTNPLPGDIIEWGPDRTNTAHVAIYIGDGEMIGIGSDNGVWQGPVSYRTGDLLGYRSFFDDNSPELGRNTSPNVV